MMARSRSSKTTNAVAAFVFVLFLTTITYGTFQETGPTVNDCKVHIDAAIKEFIAGHQEELVNTSPSSEAHITESDEEVTNVDEEPEQSSHSSEEHETEGVAQPDESDEEQNSVEQTDKQETEEANDSEEETNEHKDKKDSEENEEDATDAGVENTSEEEDDDSKEQQETAVDSEEVAENGKESAEETAEDDKESGEETVETSEEQDEATNERHPFQKDTESESDEEQESDESKTEEKVESNRDTDENDSSEAGDDDDTSKESETRDRRAADSDKTTSSKGSAEDGSDEEQETTIESPAEVNAITITTAAEEGDDDLEHPTTEQSKEDSEEEDQSKKDSTDDTPIEEEEEVVVAGPGELRTRENIETILGVSEEDAVNAKDQERVANEILKDVKRMYEGAVRPLEQLYKFKDISNRHVGDAEIFSKPMIVFMGPWSTGKSAIINYLLGTEYSRYALKTGAEPTSNSFTVVTYGDDDQVMDGTQIAADWAFSTLQKFGQTFLDRLKGRRLPNPLLQKVTIVDTPGILENRKSPERQYPFNDAFQWFIDRADLIYIVFDPTKLDIGPELEAIFDQLKGRENQVRILLNKADTVKPQELMKVQGTLLWNLSPQLGTSEAPTVFVGSFWSRPYLPGSPVTLLDAQEEAFLEDLEDALESRVETKVALARRHAVRVRNHAKMVDCYLTTYYNHKSFFSNKRKVADDIIDNPQNYHIYEGLSTMTNVSRYDLPDPDIYREFFRLHPLFDFKPLASTCSYFKGCPLDKLDIVIAYDLPELVGKYHKLLENRSRVGGK